MRVPFLDLRSQYAALREEILVAIDRLSSQASFTHGAEVEAFEREFAEFSGLPFAVAVNSGTSALHLALLAAGVGPGDEVITTSNTFIATVEVIHYTGARPVFADIDPRTANLDPEQAERAITPRTRAILPVHLYGRPAAMDGFERIAREHGLALVEDACQAHGARYHDRPVGAEAADRGARAEWIAADLIAQAEHGSGDEAAVLVTPARRKGEAVGRAVGEPPAKSPPRSGVGRGGARRSGGNHCLRPVVAGYRRLPRGSSRTTGGFSRPHHQAAGAVAIHISD